jgi:epsilon-lactone hydrolase
MAILTTKPQKPDELPTGTDAPPPFGHWVSDEARDTFKAHVKSAAQPFETILSARAFYDAQNAERLALMRRLFATESATAKIGGVSVYIVTPAGQSPAIQPNETVLICLHGGGFGWGAGAGALLEAVPIAAVSGVTIVAVDYRMAPEYSFPAATDDVVAVYRALLADRPAAKIGIYGCSAGGILVAQVVAQLQQLGEPAPGAVSMLHAPALELGGDLLSLAPMMTADPPVEGGSRLIDLPYLAGADSADPLVFPGNHPAVLAGFPPTLLITSTRDFAASSASVTHRRLLAAGVAAEFILFDGLWHAFHMSGELPESRELYERLSDFFRKRLL